MFAFPLYFVTDRFPAAREVARGDGEEFDIVVQAMEGGARLIQYRDKTATRRQMYDRAMRLRKLTQAHGAILIINDQIDLACAVGADGVHLGQDDLPIFSARKMMGHRAIIGVSTHGVAEAERAETDGADYIGLGPIFATTTKITGMAPIGVTMIAEVRKRVRLPIYAIGGIHLSEAETVIASGATGVAVISALSGGGKVQDIVAHWLATLSVPPVSGGWQAGDAAGGDDEAGVGHHP
jgi:thiamine-phosphate pyrophosphorylase